MIKALHILKKVSPDILTGLSIAGLGVTVYTSICDTKSHTKIIEAERPVTKKEKICCYAKAYWPTAIAASGTATMIILSRKISAEQLAAMTVSCITAESKLSKYRKGVADLIGKEEERNLYIETVEDAHCIFPAIPHKEEEYDDSYVFYDLYSNRYFVSSIEKVQQAMYHLNRNFTLRGFACINEYYNLLGISKIENGDTIGWEAGDLMDGGLSPWIDFFSDAKENEDGVKYYVITFDIEPTVEAFERALS